MDDEEERNRIHDEAYEKAVRPFIEASFRYFNSTAGREQREQIRIARESKRHMADSH